MILGVAILKCFLQYRSRHSICASALLVLLACVKSFPQVLQH